MKIALDYDDTFTEDPELWKRFISVCVERGHLVKFVTYRPDRKGWYNEDILSDAHSLNIDVIFTGGKQKENFWGADVWIDDSPITIPCAKKLVDMYDGCLMNNDMEEPNE